MERSIADFSPTLERWFTLLEFTGLIHGSPAHTAHLESNSAFTPNTVPVAIPYPSLFPEKASTIMGWPLTWCRVIIPGSAKSGVTGAEDGEALAILCILGPTEPRHTS